MIPLAAFAETTRLGALGGDAAATVAHLASHQTSFRFAVAAFSAIVALDVIVAGALADVLTPAHPQLARLSAYARLAYAAMLGAALPTPLTAVDVARTDRTDVAALASDALAAFARTWSLALGLFGVHLALVGAAILHASYVPRWLGWLVIVAGVGYAADSVTTTLGHPTQLVTFAFIGEVILMVWLLAKGRAAVP